MDNDDMGGQKDAITYSPSIEADSPLMLLNLPLELRLQIYGYIFHSTEYNEIGGCHCGDGLSTSSRQLYQETRPLVYKYAKPRFLDVDSCLRFLRDINDNTVYIKSLSIIDRELFSQSHRLADIFMYRGIERLEEFKFIVKPWHVCLDLNWTRPRQAIPRIAPIYSLLQKQKSPAAVYDMSLRVSKHPLASMKHLRRLRVEGYPQSFMEEAIFKAGRNIEELGRSEGKSVKFWEKGTDHTGEHSTEDWVHSIEIVD